MTILQAAIGYLTTMRKYAVSETKPVVVTPADAEKISAVKKSAGTHTAATLTDSERAKLPRS